MEHLKLFEAFNETDKVYEANSLFIYWLQFNIDEEKARAWNGVLKARFYYKFLYPEAPTHIIKPYIFEDATGYLRKQTFNLIHNAPNLWNRKPIIE